MAIEILITLTYSIATFFMMALAWGIGIITVMRRIRLLNNAPITGTAPQIVAQPSQKVFTSLGEWRDWSKKRRDNTDRIETSVVLPLRYQQPLFFGESLNDTTKQSPVISAGVKAS